MGHKTTGRTTYKPKPLGTLFENMVKRFWKNVNVEGKIPDNKKLGRCWDWEGTTRNGGYGRLSNNRKPIAAHRVSWIIHNGDPGNLCVLHKCDNPSCVNPNHLFLGTHGDNNADRTRKGRSARNLGESNGRAVLTEIEVISIRKRYKRGCKVNGKAALIREFGVSSSCIERIINLESWTHV